MTPLNGLLTRTFHGMRMAAFGQEKSLRVAKRVLADFADEGFRLVGDGTQMPTPDDTKQFQAWFEAACYTIEQITNRRDADQYRDQCELNGGLAGPKWGTILTNTAHFMQARARKLEQSDLSLSFKPYKWAKP